MKNIVNIGLCCFMGIAVGCKDTKPHDEVNNNGVQLEVYGDYNRYSEGSERKDLQIKLFDITDGNHHITINEVGILIATVNGEVYDLSEHTHCGNYNFIDFCLSIDPPVTNENTYVNISYEVNGVTMSSDFFFPDFIIPQASIEPDFDPTIDNILFEWEYRSSGEIRYSKPSNNNCITGFNDFQNTTSFIFEGNSTCSRSRNGALNFDFFFEEVPIESDNQGFNHVSVSFKQTYSVNL